MSNIVPFNAAKVPAFAKTKELSDVAKALAGSGAASGKRISIKGGVFRLLSDGKEVAAIDERFLDVVIVKAAPKIARTFFLKKYDPESPSAPDCWSPDGDKPDANASSPQSQTCNGCPQNVAGSGEGQSRACRYQQRLAVVLANEIEDGDVMQLALPAASIFGKEEGDNRPLQAYARWLLAQSVDPSTVVTRMKFDTSAESPKLFFKPMRWLTDEEYEITAEKGKSPDALKAISMNVAVFDGVAKPVALEGKAPKAAKAPEQEEEPTKPAARRGRPPKAQPEVEPEQEAEEPTKLKANGAAPSSVPGKKGLAEVVAGWDDEE